MNSLNLLSARVIGQSKPPRSRSLSDGLRRKDSRLDQPKRSASQHAKADYAPEEEEEEKPSLVIKREDSFEDDDDSKPAEVDEKTPLLSEDSSPVLYNSRQQKSRFLHLIVKRIVDALTRSLEVIWSTLKAPPAYVYACLRDEQGRFSVLAPLRRRRSPRNGTKSTAHAVGLSGSGDDTDSSGRRSEKRNLRSGSQRRRSVSPATSDSEADSKTGPRKGMGHRRTPSRTIEEPSRRSISIKVSNEEAQRKKSKKSQRTASDVAKSAQVSKEEAAAAELKSPTSPAASFGMTKYPHAPAPPRPLIPRRQSSYSNITYSPNSIEQKTLVIDLDETLIHSLAKGGRMSSGHMVEVKLAHPAAYNGLTLGPQHPILYYVHKRPHCDDFLRRVSKWYNLVVFTASVQEYADPVIDWLEQEKKYFSKRYYRQHCTFRNGAYIKDLSSVEPDLSKVMILDNSPLSYIFHEGEFQNHY